MYLKAWLSRVARNRAIDRLRSAQRLELRDEVPDRNEEPAQLTNIERGEVADRVLDALDHLPDRQRVALTLFHFEEMSQREVAAVLEISEDALESLLARGRRKLKGLLEPEWRSMVATLSQESTPTGEVM